MECIVSGMYVTVTYMHFFNLQLNVIWNVLKNCQKTPETGQKTTETCQKTPETGQKAPETCQKTPETGRKHLKRARKHLKIERIFIKSLGYSSTFASRSVNEFQ